MLFDSKHLAVVVLTLLGGCIEITLPENPSLERDSQRRSPQESPRELSPRTSVETRDQPDAGVKPDAVNPDAMDAEVEPIKAVVLVLSSEHWIADTLVGDASLGEIVVETLSPERPLGGWLKSSAFPGYSDFSGCVNLSVEADWNAASLVVISDGTLGGDALGCNGRFLVDYLREDDLWFASEGYPGTTPWSGVEEVASWIRSIGS